MKPGTPGFIGQRLREAREAREFTATSLADVIGVTRSAVSRYETAEGSPSTEIMKKISQALNMPEPYFRFRPRRAPTGTIFYRSMSAATKGARKRAEQRYSWMREIVGLIKNYVQLPAVNLPDCIVPNEPTRLSQDEIESIASTVRQFWGLGDGPIPNIVSLLENNGFIIAREELGADTLDALSEYDHTELVPYIVLGSDKASAVRSRFDAAHELGHIILHRNIENIKLGRKSEHALLEKQAHRFAGAFLLPEKSFAGEFYSATLDSLLAIKKKWKVSIAMMIKRAEDLNFIDPSTVKRLWINYSRRGWRKYEPFDEEMAIEEPKLMRCAIELLLAEKILNREQLLNLLPFTPNDIESLAGLNRSYLTGEKIDHEPQIRILRPSKMEHNSPVEPGKPAKIFPFQPKAKS